MYLLQLALTHYSITASGMRGVGLHRRNPKLDTTESLHPVGIVPYYVLICILLESVDACFLILLDRELVKAVYLPLVVSDL